MTYILKNILGLASGGVAGYLAEDYFFNPDNKKDAMYNRPQFIKLKDRALKSLAELNLKLENDQQKLNKVVQRISEKTFQASQKFYDFDRAMRDAVLNIHFDIVKKKWRRD